MKTVDIAHPDLLIAQQYVYEPLGLSYKQLILEEESREYGACEFSLDNHTIKFRVSKITPTKTGQFVTFWKRIEKGPILSYDSSDNFDILIISARCGEQLGQFVFSKSVLLKHGIISENGIGGKRAIRVYPPWDAANNAQAKKTQMWQLSYFFEIKKNILAFNRIKQLLF